MLTSILVLLAALQGEKLSDMDYLHRVAHEVIDASRIEPSEEIQRGGKNTTGFALRVPGGTKSYYPAFWIRDASMMLGSDLVLDDEIQGWIKVVAATQPGPKGIDFPHGLHIPPYSIPDHITLSGEACWFPGAFTEQGVGNYGFLPPADDAFYFVQMAWEQFDLAGDTKFFKSPVKTQWGEHSVSEVCEKAFSSVEADPATGLVICSDKQGQGRVDWGFCDSVTKTGLCLMPSLLRAQAAKRLALMLDAVGRHDDGDKYRDEYDKIRKQIFTTFYRPLVNHEGMLLSATGLGKKDDIWAAAFAIWLHILPASIEEAVSAHLIDLYRRGNVATFGQIRHMPVDGEFGGFWEKCSSAQSTYQNGGYWATPTGWMVAAMGKTYHRVGAELLSTYIDYLKRFRKEGAPFEWVSFGAKKQVNANYGSSIGLVYIALKQAGYR